VVFSATGIRGSVTSGQLALLSDGAFLAVAGGKDEEIPMSYLHALGTGRTVRPQVDAYELPNGRVVKVIADGECMNVSAAEGNPIEIMDLSLSLQALAVRELAVSAKREPGVYPLPDRLVREVAALRLRSAGATLEPMTSELAQAMAEW
jgi:adenosylhomocysteinase